MRYVFISFLAICLGISGCKKAAPPAPVAAAEAAPAPTAPPQPTPEPAPTQVAIDPSAQAIVLCYHRFEEHPKPKDTLAITPAEFEAQMQALKDQGITVISMEDFLAWRRGEKNIPAKSAVISIDDGYLSGYLVAWPILKKFDYPFTMFIYTDYVKGGPRSGGQSMTWEQLEEMRDAGVDIGCHTVSHSILNAKNGKTDQQYQDWLHNEIYNSKAILEQKLGIQIKTIAYPFGIHNEVVRQMVRDAGYEAAFTVYGQHMSHTGDPTLLGRYAVEAGKPQIFKAAADFKNGGGGESSAMAGVPMTTVMPASATMLTIPADGETISDPTPEIKVNIATFGNVDPKSVIMRLSGLGSVPVKYDPATKTVSYKMQQKLRAPVMSVIVSALADGKKVETRWSFHFDPVAGPAAAHPAPAATAAPAEDTIGPAAPASANATAAPAKP